MQEFIEGKILYYANKKGLFIPRKKAKDE